MASVQEATEMIKKGKVVVCPTDTVYGLVADATNEKAVKRIFQIKGRGKGKALPVFVKNVAMAKKFARVSKEQEEFLRKVWPGKVTVVFQSKHVLPKALEMDGKVALRIPKHELVAALLKKLNRPLTGTSANVSGQPSCSSATEVNVQFARRKHQPDLVVDEGKLPKSKPSKIVDITGEKMRILRR
ncbi:MAG TPA: L-threonylcarbamoyladenylate synthase [Candidatus Paceibacterota bacterium]|nr:L-threonylcarbamoyladenylate synthase [Candidatus Paceibacterota bacterium]